MREHPQFMPREQSEEVEQKQYQPQTCKQAHPVSNQLPVEQSNAIPETDLQTRNKILAQHTTLHLFSLVPERVILMVNVRSPFHQCVCGIEYNGAMELAACGVKYD